MKYGMLAAMAAVFAFAPVWAAAEKTKDKEPAKATEKAKEKPAAKAADKKADKADAEDGGVQMSAEELAKARKKYMSAKKLKYTKIGDAKKIAELGQWPILVAAIPKISSPALQELEKKVLGRKEFLQDFAKKNFVYVQLKIEKNDKEPKKIKLQGFKEPDLKFLENFVVSERAISQAKQNNKDEPTFKDLDQYPCVVCVSPDMTKELFRLPNYDREGGFGVWLSQLVDQVKSKDIEPELSPLVNKIIENPDDPKKWK